ncbi:lipid droplet-associated hydrolase [Engraulis encrasicolus]|uniref:lipid droplet-associated hydrolase n=1 Tax=Engraulis encrasicolus TaxID=184585 RepID=UPI002FD26AC3
MEMGAEGDMDKASVEHLYCCGAVTELLKFGPRDLRRTSAKLLFLVIPGNPGVVGFYKTFMQTLYQSFGRRYPVWAVSHAGHCNPPDAMDMVEDSYVTESRGVFGLQGQIDHKLSFLQQHVPRDTRLVLIGHSIGCYIILDMMRKDPGLKVLKSVLLFPTIERMAATPHFRVPGHESNAMYMGGQEMRMVLERDNATIRHNLNKLVFYYGATDHWCPVQYYHDIKKDFPTGDIRLCESGLRHAFVLDAGKRMADMVTEWLQSDLKDL